MSPADVPPTRVRLYGILSMTRRSYLTLQSVVLVVLLVVLAVGAVAMVRARQWLPELDAGPLGGTPGWLLRQVLIGLFWLGLLTLVLEGMETLVVLRKFAREEAINKAKHAALDTQPFAPNPAAVQPPPGVQATPPPEP